MNASHITQTFRTDQCSLLTVCTVANAFPHSFVTVMGFDRDTPVSHTSSKWIIYWVNILESSQIDMLTASFGTHGDDDSRCEIDNALINSSLWMPHRRTNCQPKGILWTMPTYLAVMCGTSKINCVRRWDAPEVNVSSFHSFWYTFFVIDRWLCAQPAHPCP